MNEPRIEDCFDPPPSALVLPPESRLTLARLGGERHRALGRCLEGAIAREPLLGAAAFVRTFNFAWPRYLDAWLLEETAIAARALARHVACPGSLVLSQN